ncbi:MAG: hypothetical protein JWR69_2629 [Pedosphaera sp.]|nr:hypothetical protein [Pedosphaera sp.]
MSPNLTARRGSPFATLRRLKQPRAVPERCELCSVALAPGHRHLLEMSTRQVACACDQCALRFQVVVGGRFKLIPRYPHALPDFRLTDGQWESLALPIDLAFLFHHTPGGKMMALYPSPAGATESLLPLEAWKILVADNPALTQMEPDVEALLVNRAGTARQYYIAPIDACYELVGLIRVHWRGLSGGEEVWEQIAAFFARLEERSEPLSETGPEVSHA